MKKNDKVSTQRSQSKNQTVIIESKHEAHQLMLQNLTGRNIPKKNSLFFS